MWMHWLYSICCISLFMLPDQSCFVYTNRDAPSSSCMSVHFFIYIKFYFEILIIMMIVMTMMMMMMAMRISNAISDEYEKTGHESKSAFCVRWWWLLIYLVVFKFWYCVLYSIVDILWDQSVLRKSKMRQER